MERAALVAVFDQILEGYDIPKPEGMLKLSVEKASERIDGAPYSLLTNLAHTVLWQEFWLRKLDGGRQSSGRAEWDADFRIPDPSEFPELRKRFLDGFRAARDLAAATPFVHKCSSDDVAVETLVRIAVHGSYHIGQMNVLKRMASGKYRSK